MWLFTTVGFFSVVQKPGTDKLTVRARVAPDLDRLRRATCRSYHRRQKKLARIILFGQRYVTRRLSKAWLGSRETSTTVTSRRR